MMGKPTTAAALAAFLPEYHVTHKLSPQQAKVVNCIRCCQTPILGGRRFACDQCQAEVIQYHSCRNRHCPRCQRAASEDWLSARQQDLLPAPYYHVVFTLPHEFNGWVSLHPDVIYRLLFSSVWATLKQFGQDPKRLNGELGMTAILHTWGQNLSRHVHLHCLVPGGAFAPEQQQWHPARSTYLFPVKALSRHFRGKMVSLLRDVYQQGELVRVTRGDVDHILDLVMSKDWVVYSRGTCEHSERVLSYLARYTHRIALSDHRLHRIDEKGVSFGWKDYANEGRHKSLKLEGVEFIRRLLLHVLPHGFMRIRHYGFLANCHRRRKLNGIRECLGQPVLQQTSPEDTLLITAELLVRVTSDRQQCPKCKKGVLHWQCDLLAQSGWRRRYG